MTAHTNSFSRLENLAELTRAITFRELRDAALMDAARLRDAGVRPRDRVALIYRGQLVEEGDTETVFRSPASDYARMLLAAMPDPDPDRSPFHASSHAARPAPGPGQPPAASP